MMSASLERVTGASPPAFVQVDWVNQSVIYFNYNDFKSACPYRDFEFALRRVCAAGASEAARAGPRVQPR